MNRSRRSSETLSRVTDYCHGDERPNCPILDELEGEGEVVHVEKPVLRRKVARMPSVTR